MKPLGQGECWSEEVPVLKGSLKSHTSKKKKRKRKKKEKIPYFKSLRLGHLLENHRGLVPSCTGRLVDFSDLSPTLIRKNVHLSESSDIPGIFSIKVS